MIKPFKIEFIDPETMFKVEDYDNINIYLQKDILKAKWYVYKENEIIIKQLIVREVK